MALDPGNVVQNAIYLSGGTPWPVGADAWEARARELLEQGPEPGLVTGQLLLGLAGGQRAFPGQHRGVQVHRRRPGRGTGAQEGEEGRLVLVEELKALAVALDGERIGQEGFLNAQGLLESGNGLVRLLETIP